MKNEYPSLPSSFQQTICNTFGEKGKDWLNKLPDIILKLKEKWLLSNIQLVPNLSYHFVAKATQYPDIPVVLKIGCDIGLTLREAIALNHFQNAGFVKVLAFEEILNALLLEQAIPGHSLKSLYPQKINQVIDVYGTVISNIHKQSFSQNKMQVPSIATWLEALNNVNSLMIHEHILEEAKNKRNKLLSTMQTSQLLHGDLHLDNILEHQGNWVCIDPKGVTGELEFEVAAFDIFSPSEIKTATTYLFLDRIHKLAKATNLDAKRLKDWFFVRLVLSAAWAIEDKQNPSKALELAALLLPDK